MKAIVQNRYGSAEVLKAQEIEKPEIGENEVLVRVHAASIHVGDWILMTGSPFVMRLATGLRKPKNRVPGTDVAGTVEAVGKDVTQHRPGDEVFGWVAGAFAEYARATEDHFVTKPAGVTFEEAASVGVSATTALQLLRDDGRVQPGQKVLINGASGGVGTFAVQIAKSFGAEVTGVTSTRNIDLVRSLGADYVVDYTTSDFVRRGRRYDLILDTIGNLSVRDLRGALAEGGRAAVVGFSSVAKLISVSLRGGRNLAQVSAHVATTDLEFLANLIEAGKVRPHIDRRYPFTEIPAAIAYLEQGHARGKVVAGTP